MIVTAEGNPDLRAAAHRWLAAAPDPDQVWDYAASRPAVPDLVLRFGDTEVDVASTTVAVTAHRSTVDVQLYHPALAALPHAARMQAAFLLLDQLLGEVAVEIWVGVIEVASGPPPEAVPLIDLVAQVEALRSAHTTSDGELTWGVAQLKGPMGSVILVSAQVPLKAATAPRFDTHVAVSLDFRSPPGGHGLPAQDALDALRAHEDRLIQVVGDDGRLVAHETHAGRRTLSFYVDGTTGAADRLRVGAASWTLAKHKVKAWHDPSWDQVARLRF
jgi:hypothetical protein